MSIGSILSPELLGAMIVIAILGAILYAFQNPEDTKAYLKKAYKWYVNRKNKQHKLEGENKHERKNKTINQRMDKEHN